MKQAESEVITQAERLADAIADAVLAGEFAPGFRLDETMLADRFGVSRTPVREALRQLATSGLIEAKPRRGATVAQATSEQLEKLFGAMAEMEATCARLAAMSMAPIERRRLQNLQETMTTIVQRDDRDAYAGANVAFHSQIYRGAHNEILADIATGLRRRVAPYRRAQFRTEGRLMRSHAEHAAVVKAIIACDAADAHAAMFHHMSLVEDSVGLLAAPRAPGRERPHARRSEQDSGDSGRRPGPASSKRSGPRERLALARTNAD